MGKSEFIKDYDRILPLLKNIFFYGSYSRSDLAMEGICGKSKYYESVSMLKYMFGDLLEEQTNRTGEKALHLRWFRSSRSLQRKRALAELSLICGNLTRMRLRSMKLRVLRLSEDTWK